MSVNPTTNFMSNEYILSWMEAKTEGIYGKMRTAMDSSDDRANAEAALNTLKGKIADAAANQTDAALLRPDIEDVISKYGTEFPDLKSTLQPVLDELNKRYEQNDYEAKNPKVFFDVRIYDPSGVGAPVSISKDESDRWGKSFDSQVEAFSKVDQLSMINIQEYNAQLNQAKQTASALMDAADKSANAIINHIS